MAIRSASAASAPEQHPTPSDQTTMNLQQRSRGSGRRSVRSKVRRRRLASLFLCGLSAFVMAGSTGCSVFSGVSNYWRRSDFCDEFIISHRNQALALKAWYREKSCHRHEPYLREFKAGFLEGYADVANGGPGCVPAVAPSQYWGWKYQSAHGQEAINAWFAGYPLGVKAAEQDGVGHWGSVRPMGMNQPTPANMVPPGLPAGAAYVIGPDGKPMITETIIPGEPTPVETLDPELEDLELGSPADLSTPLELGPPAPAADDEAMKIERSDSIELSNAIEGSVLPAIDDTSDSLRLDPAQGPRTLNAAVTFDEGASTTATLSDAENLVPKQAPATFSMNDLGDDAIEGIFGASQESPRVALVVDEPATPQGSTPLSETQGSESEETAAGADAIPFKFE